MKLRPADLGEAFATPVVTQRVLGKFERITMVLFRVFYRKRTGFSVRFVDSTLNQITNGTPLVTSLLIPGGMLVGSSLAYVPDMLHGISQALLIQGILHTFRLNVVLFFIYFAGIKGKGLQRQFTNVVSHQEAYAFYQAQTDPTSRIYAHLVCDLVQAHDVVPAAIPALRDAVRLFGEAVHGLSTKKFAQGDAGSIRRRAANARERAFSESDPVLKTALVQEADAYEGAAVAATRNALMAKRVAALQDALIAQMEALRLELPAFQASNTDMTHLLTLSEKVRAVTAQAGAITSAHAELDAIPNTATTVSAQKSATPVMLENRQSWN